MQARRPLVIVPYNPRWPEEFRSIAGELRAVVGDRAERIDHIGSTAVPGLAAKDVIDIQITVASLDASEPLVHALQGLGFVKSPELAQDHLPHGRSEERRVGKECRSRWWPYHEQKNKKSAVEQAKHRPR